MKPKRRGILFCRPLLVRSTCFLSSPPLFCFVFLIYPPLEIAFARRWRRVLALFAVATHRYMSSFPFRSTLCFAANAIANVKARVLPPSHPIHPPHPVPPTTSPHLPLSPSGSKTLATNRPSHASSPPPPPSASRFAAHARASSHSATPSPPPSGVPVAPTRT